MVRTPLSVENTLINIPASKLPDITYDVSFEPAIDGYYYAFFEFDSELKNKLFKENTDSQEWVFAGSISSITVPDIILEDTTWIGYHDSKYHHPLSMEYTSNDITINFIDTQESIISKILTRWINSIRPQNASSNLVKFKANLLIALYPPAMKEPTFALLAMGVHPTSVPLSNIQIDIGSHNLRSLNVSFKVDRIVCDDIVLQNVKNSSVLQSLVPKKN